MEECELKHHEELSSSHNLVWEFEAWVAKKEIITKKRVYTVELEERLGNMETTLQAIEERVTTAESSTWDVVSWAINDYKILVDFEQEVIEGLVEAYLLGFSDYKE